MSETLQRTSGEDRGSPFLEVLAQDVRYAVRTLRRDSGFFLAAVVIMGLGIGASCTIFSVLNTLLIRPLPFNDPSRLVWVANGNGKEEGLSGQTTQVDYLLDLQRQNESFADIAAYFAFYGVGDNKLTGAGEPERLTGVPVTQNFFALLGIQPVLGRYFSTDECKWNGPKVVMLSNGIWKRRFGSDPAIVGKAITLDDAPSTVVGVLPASFDFGSVFAPGSRMDLFFPFPLSPETNRWGNTLAIVGRLKPGVSVQNAQAEADVLGARMDKEHPDRNGFSPYLTLDAGAGGRAVASGVVFAGGRGGRGDADRVRELVKFAAGSRSGAAEGDGHSRGDRCSEGPAGAADFDGERAAVELRRACWDCCWRWRARERCRI